jgi:hypothetical protein
VFVSPFYACVIYVILLNMLNSSPLVPKLVLPSNPGFVPMAGVSNDIVDAIWDRILRFAFEVDTYCHGVIDDQRVRMLSRLKQTRVSIAQVCRTFRVFQFIYIFYLPFKLIKSLSASPFLINLAFLFLPNQKT